MSTRTGWFSLRLFACAAALIATVQVRLLRPDECDNNELTDYPLAKPLLPQRTDLAGDIPSDRPLSLEDLDLLLKLSSFLLDKQNDRVDRGTAARDLGILGHHYALPALLAIIRDETDDYGVRQRCIIALSMMRDKRVVDYLIDVLTYDTPKRYITQVNYEAKVQLNEMTWVSIGFGEQLETGADWKNLQTRWRAWWRENREAAYLRRGGTGHPIDMYSPEEWKPELVRPRVPPAGRIFDN